MENVTLQKYYHLPLELRKEVVDFIEFLAQKYAVKDNIPPSEKKSNFGSAKGLIVMSDDFNEPLEDFKEYM